MTNKKAFHFWNTFVSVIQNWLGRWFLIQTYGEEDSELLQDIQETRALLKDHPKDDPSVLTNPEGL
jgi:hypothetical protein